MHGSQLYGENSQTLMLTDVVLNSQNNYWVLDCFQWNFSYTYVSVDISRRGFECV